MPHMRVSIRRVDKPIFHFSVVTAKKYKTRHMGSEGNPLAVDFDFKTW